VICKLGLSQELLWPVNAAPALTASFCEFRPRHFHGGVDVKTYGMVGPICRAVADGWVSRIKVSSVGYGRALYLTLADGRTAVYAHLNSFADPVEDLIREEQLRQRSYSVELFFDDAAKLPFRGGETVAYAGQSGTMHPHLHFEIRDPAERPLNPIFNGISVPDSIAPVLLALAVTPLDGSSTVEGDCQPRIYDPLTRLRRGVWSPGDPIGVSGRVGLSVDAYDKTNASDNVLAAYRFELRVDGETRWVTSYDRFDFDDNRKIELERDYRLMRRGKGVYHRLYRVLGNDLQFSTGDGAIEVGNQGAAPIEVEIVVSDAAGNPSVVALTLTSDKFSDDSRAVGGDPLIVYNPYSGSDQNRIHLDQFDGYIRLSAPPGIMGFNLDGNLNTFLSARPVEGGVAAVWVPTSAFNGRIEITAIRNDSIVVGREWVGLEPVFPGEPAKVCSEDSLFRIMVQPASLYDTALIRILPQPSYEVKGLVESVYRVEPRDQPLASAIKVSIIRRSGSTDDFGWGVYYYDSRMGWVFLGNEPEAGYLSANALSWELFGLMLDLDKPAIASVTLSRNDTLRTRRPSFLFGVSDKGSGLSAVGLNMKLDGETLPAEWDPPRGRFLFQPWWDLARGPHQLSVEARDRVGNTTSKTFDFTIITNH